MVEQQRMTATETKVPQKGMDVFTSQEVKERIKQHCISSKCLTWNRDDEDVTNDRVHDTKCHVCLLTAFSDTKITFQLHIIKTYTHIDELIKYELIIISIVHMLPKEI